MALEMILYSSQGFTDSKLIEEVYNFVETNYFKKGSEFAQNLQSISGTVIIYSAICLSCQKKETLI
jgi:hypothetical protein